MGLAKAVPIIATIAALLGALSAFSWFAVQLDAGPPDLLAFLTFLVLIVLAVFLISDWNPLAVSMGVLQLLLAGGGLLLFIGEIAWEGGNVEFSTTFRMQYPPLAALGVLGLVIMGIARHEDIYPRWNLWATIGVAWLACAMMFFTDQGTDGKADAFAIVPGLLALVVAGLGVVHVMNAD